MAKSITLYTFENCEGDEDGFDTQDFREARQYAQEHSLRIIANEFVWDDAYAVEGEDYTEQEETEEGRRGIGRGRVLVTNPVERTMYFDRFDICEAHCVLEWDYNIGGWLQERPSNQKRRESTGVQLSRIGFRFKPTLTFDTLSENGQEIYRELERRYGFRKEIEELDECS